MYEFPTSSILFCRNFVAHCNENMEDTVIKVEGMTCDHCVQSVGRILQEVEGVDGYDIDLEANSVDVSFDPNKTTRALLIDQINHSEIYTAA